MVAPLVYGVYLIAGIAGRATAKYAVKKIGERVVGKLVSRHKTIDAAKNAFTRLRNALSTSKDTGKPMFFKNLPPSARAKFQDVSGKPYSMTKPKTPGVTAGGGTTRSAVIGKERVKDYTLKRRVEGLGAGLGAGAVAGASITSIVKGIKEAKKEDAPMGPLKTKFIKAVKDKTDDPKKIAQARTDFDQFVAGKKRSLNFNYGGVVKKTKAKKKRKK
tara:strand:- start:25 stop:675 length:651 start_codon:yes stop_codon:yes gene_type:complete